VTAEFDPATPNMARVYDYWLSGKDNYPADRAEAERLLGIYPPLQDLVRENRAFVTQAVSWAARQGIGQFIDLGAGLPAFPAVHQAARKVMPSARVAYVDIDPVVLSHARALLVTSDGVTAVAADLRDPGAVLADPELRAVIADMNSPSALKPEPRTSAENEPEQDNQTARLDELLARADQAAQRIAAQQAERQASSDYAARIELEAQTQAEAGQQVQARDEAELEL
jgi:hypothetical protein